MRNKLLTISFILLLILLTGCGINNKYLVTYDLGYDDEQIVFIVEGDQTLEKPDEPEREGYLFNGWFLNLSDEKPYEFNETLTNNITLYAKWRDAVNNVSITFTDGQGYTYENQVVLANSKSTKPKDPIKVDYDFKYWALEGSEFDFDSIVTSNITLVAVFEASYKEEYRNELISKINDFNNKLIDSDYQIEFNLKGLYESYLNTFQYRHNKTSVITVDRGFGFIDYFLLEPKGNNLDYLLAEEYNSNDSSNLHLFSYYEEEIKRINISELNMLKDDYKVKKVNDTYIVNVTWEDISISNHPLFNYDLKHYYFNNLNNIRRDDLVTLEFKLDETIEITISVASYEIKSTYYQDLKPLLLDLGQTLQLGEKTYEKAIFPIKENMWHYERVPNFEKETYYFLFDLEAGYYEISHASEAYEFLDLEGNQIDFETIYAFNNFNYKYDFLINVSQPMKFYMGLKTKASLTRYVSDYEQVGIIYNKYDYNYQEPLISDGNNLDLDGLSGGLYDPFIIEVVGDYEAYEIITNGDLQNLNFTGGSIISTDGSVTYFYKKADMDRYLLYITGDDVSLKTKSITMQGDVVTSEKNPYVLTTEYSPIFYTASAYNGNHFTINVEEEGIYQVEALFEEETNYYLWVGGKSLEPGNSVFLSVGQHRVSISSSYYRSFSIRYQLRKDVLVDVLVGEEVSSFVYAYTKISYTFNNTVDSAVSLAISHNYSYDLEFTITTPEGVTHAYFKDEIPNLYLKAGTYVISTKIASLDYEITFKATSLAIPNHTNYSYDYQKFEFGKEYVIENSIFGHFYDLKFTYNDNFFYFTGNVKFYQITGYSFDELNLSRDFNRYTYNEAIKFYIKAGVTGNLRATIGSY